MRHAGFVLAGGHSSRMGRDKALLPYRGGTLIEHLAAIVRDAVGRASVIGDPARYGRFGYPVHPDQVAGCGPAGGIYTALRVSPAEWNVIVACDMPGITVAALEVLVEETKSGSADCIVPVGLDGQPEPLCAVYHARCLSRLELAIREKRLKMRDLVPELRPMLVAAVDAASFSNINTPEDWEQVEEPAR